MHAGRNYTLREVAFWTRRETLVFFLISAPPTAAYAFLGWTWLSLPWLPIALLGTAVAFITGFKNNASYDRAWEARKVWGAIVNASRSWAVMAIDFVADVGDPAAPDKPAEGELERVRTRLVHRHIAWLAALRYQLRQRRVWETQQQRANVEYRANFTVAEERERSRSIYASFWAKRTSRRRCSRSGTSSCDVRLKFALIPVGVTPLRKSSR